MSIILEKLGKTAPAAIAAGQDYCGVVDPIIAPLWKPLSMYGIAYTVEVPAADNKAVHRAIDEAPTGSILVAVNGGHRDTAIVGDIIIRNCIKRDFRGFVTDGVVRDLAVCRVLGMPIFAAGVCIRGPSKIHDGRLGETVSLGGVNVETGDYLIGDDDGIVVVKPNEAEAVLKKAEQKEALEVTIVDRIARGENTIDIFSLRN